MYDLLPLANSLYGEKARNQIIKGESKERRCGKKGQTRSDGKKKEKRFVQSRKGQTVLSENRERTTQCSRERRRPGHKKLKKSNRRTHKPAFPIDVVIIPSFLLDSFSAGSYFLSLQMTPHYRNRLFVDVHIKLNNCRNRFIPPSN